MPDLNLAVIGNSIVAALVDRRGRIVWYCLPRLDGDPIFGSLLNGDDPADGFFEVSLEHHVSSTQQYLENTAVLATTLTDAQDAAVRITDFVPRFKRYDRIFRPAMLVRRIEPIRGLPMVRIRLRPMFGYGGARPSRTLGSNHLRYVTTGMALRLTTDAPIAYIESEAAFALTAPVTLFLGPDEPLTDSITQLS